jgi:hypothetical protein
MCLEAVPQNSVRSVSAPDLVAGLLLRLVHQFLMARQALPQLLQAVAELITVARLIFDLIADLVAQLIALLIRAGGHFLLLVAQLGLILLTGLGHVFHGVFHFGRETGLQPGAILFERRTARLEAVLILLLHALRARAASTGSVGALSHRETRRTSQAGDGDYE